MAAAAQPVSDTVLATCETLVTGAWDALSGAIVRIVDEEDAVFLYKLTRIVQAYPELLQCVLDRREAVLAALQTELTPVGHSLIRRVQTTLLELVAGQLDDWRERANARKDADAARLETQRIASAVERRQLEAEANARLQRELLARDELWQARLRGQLEKHAAEHQSELTRLALAHEHALRDAAARERRAAEQLDELRAKIAKLAGTLEAREREVAEAAAEAEALRALIAQLRAQLTDGAEARAANAQSLADQRAAEAAQLETLRGRVAALERERDELARALADAQRQAGSASGEAAQLRASLADARTALDRSEAALDGARAALDENAAELARLRGALAEGERRTADALAALAARTRALIASGLDGARAQLGALRAATADALADARDALLAEAEAGLRAALLDAEGHGVGPELDALRASHAQLGVALAAAAATFFKQLAEAAAERDAECAAFAAAMRDADADTAAAADATRAAEARGLELVAQARADAAATAAERAAVDAAALGADLGASETAERARTDALLEARADLDGARAELGAAHAELVATRAARDAATADAAGADAALRVSLRLVGEAAAADWEEMAARAAELVALLEGAEAERERLRREAAAHARTLADAQTETVQLIEQAASNAAAARADAADAEAALAAAEAKGFLAPGSRPSSRASTRPSTAASVQRAAPPLRPPSAAPAPPPPPPPRAAAGDADGGVGARALAAALADADAQFLALELELGRALHHAQARAAELAAERDVLGARVAELDELLRALSGAASALAMTGKQAETIYLLARTNAVRTETEADPASPTVEEAAARQAAVLARQLATDRLGALRRAQRGVGLRGKQASSGDLALAKRQARSGLTLRGVDGAAASERSSMGAIGESTDAPAPPPTTTTQPPSGGGADGRPSTTGARARGAPGTPPARSWSPAASPASTHEQPRAASPFGAHHAAALDETTRAARGGAKFVGTLAAGSGSYVGKLFDGDGGEREQPGARHRARPRRASDSSASSDDDDAPVADGARGAAAAAGGGVGAFDASTFDLALDLPKVLKRFVKTLARCLALEAHAAAIDAEAARARESAERETAERALAEARASELQQRVLALESHFAQELLDLKQAELDHRRKLAQLAIDSNAPGPLGEAALGTMLARPEAERTPAEWAALVAELSALYRAMHADFLSLQEDAAMQAAMLGAKIDELNGALLRLYHVVAEGSPELLFRAHELEGLVGLRDAQIARLLGSLHAQRRRTTGVADDLALAISLFPSLAPILTAAAKHGEHRGLAAMVQGEALAGARRKPARGGNRRPATSHGAFGATAEGEADEPAAAADEGVDEGGGEADGLARRAATAEASQRLSSSSSRGPAVRPSASSVSYAPLPPNASVGGWVLPDMGAAKRRNGSPTGSRTSTQASSRPTTRASAHELRPITPGSELLVSSRSVAASRAAEPSSVASWLASENAYGTGGRTPSLPPGRLRATAGLHRSMSEHVERASELTASLKRATAGPGFAPSSLAGAVTCDRSFLISSAQTLSALGPAAAAVGGGAGGGYTPAQARSTGAPPPPASPATPVGAWAS